MVKNHIIIIITIIISIIIITIVIRSHIGSSYQVVHTFRHVVHMEPLGSGEHGLRGRKRPRGGVRQRAAREAEAKVGSLVRLFNKAL